MRTIVISASCFGTDESTSCGDRFLPVIRRALQYSSPRMGATGVGSLALKQHGRRFERPTMNERCVTTTLLCVTESSPEEVSTCSVRS